MSPERRPRDGHQRRMHDARFAHSVPHVVLPPTDLGEVVLIELRREADRQEVGRRRGASEGGPDPVRRADCSPGWFGYLIVSSNSPSSKPSASVYGMCNCPPNSAFSIT